MIRMPSKFAFATRTHLVGLGRWRGLRNAAMAVLAVALAGCATYGDYGYGGGYYGEPSVGYYGAYSRGYGYGGYGGYGYDYPYGYGGSRYYYGDPYGYYSGYYGYPYRYHRPRPPHGTTQPPTQGSIGNPPPWRDPVRRQQRLSGQPVPSLGDRGMVEPRAEQGSRAPLQIRRERPVQDYRPQPSMERPVPRMERAAPRMERSAPRFERQERFERRSERDAGPELTP